MVVANPLQASIAELAVHFVPTVHGKNELLFFGAQPLNEIRGIKSLHAVLDRDDCADLENYDCGFIILAPIVQHSRLKQMLKHCSSEEDGVQIRTGITLLRDHSRIDANPASVIGDYTSD